MSRFEALRSGKTLLVGREEEIELLRHVLASPENKVSRGSMVPVFGGCHTTDQHHGGVHQALRDARSDRNAPLVRIGTAALTSCSTAKSTSPE